MTQTSKVAQITLVFWAMKICATTLGETAGDLLTMTLGLGYALGSLLLLALFAASLVVQLRAATFHPARYWLVILTTSTAGTAISDYMDRTLSLGYAGGSLLIGAVLALVLAIWWAVEGTLSVQQIVSRRVETFYWFAILSSNTLGTALGDYLADSSGLGFLGGASLIGAVLALIAVLYGYTRMNRVLLFWAAFVLTRPLGATLGDWLTKPDTAGGLALGTVSASAWLALAMLLFAGLSGRRPGSAAA